MVEPTSGRGSIRRKRPGDRSLSNVVSRAERCQWTVLTESRFGKEIRLPRVPSGKSFRAAISNFSCRTPEFTHRRTDFPESGELGTGLVYVCCDSEWYRLVKPPLAVGTCRLAGDRNRGAFFIYTRQYRTSNSEYPISNAKANLRHSVFGHSTSPSLAGKLLPRGQGFYYLWSLRQTWNYSRLYGYPRSR